MVSTTIQLNVSLYVGILRVSPVVTALDVATFRLILIFLTSLYGASPPVQLQLFRIDHLCLYPKLGQGGIVSMTMLSKQIFDLVVF